MIYPLITWLQEFYCLGTFSWLLYYLIYLVSQAELNSYSRTNLDFYHFSNSLIEQLQHVCFALNILPHLLRNTNMTKTCTVFSKNLYSSRIRRRMSSFLPWPGRNRSVSLPSFSPANMWLVFNIHINFNSFNKYLLSTRYYIGA